MHLDSLKAPLVLQAAEASCDLMACLVARSSKSEGLGQLLANLVSAFSSLLKIVAPLREPESSSSESEFHLPWSDVEERRKRSREEMENVSSEV